MPMVDILLTWWLKLGRYPWSRLYRTLLEQRYGKLSLPPAQSVTEVASILRQVTWTMDGPLHLFDCISYPQTTWVKKKDDCDGFSILAAELLNRLNSSYNPVLVTALVHPIRYSHTVCAFTSQQGTLSYFDNYSLKSEINEKYEDIIKTITKEHQLVCWDVRNPINFDMIEFHKHNE